MYADTACFTSRKSTVSIYMKVSCSCRGCEVLSAVGAAAVCQTLFTKQAAYFGSSAHQLPAPTTVVAYCQQGQSTAASEADGLC